MGSSCSHSADALSHLVTTEEVRVAVKSIEAWQKAQEQSKSNGVVQRSRGPLLQRVGGIDVVKQVVEAWYRKLYANERLLVFLHDKEVVNLRAKQSSFMSWLFGPPSLSYSGKNLRIAHLRLIKQRGFSTEDFDLGMDYFEAAMRELEAPETVINEVMNKILPYKDVIFTPSAKDVEEEARWAMEERLRQQQAADQAAVEQRAADKRASQQTANAQSAPETALAASSSTRGLGRTPQCPFTGGRLSRPASGAAAAAIPASSGIEAERGAILQAVQGALLQAAQAAVAQAPTRGDAAAQGAPLEASLQPPPTQPHPAVASSSATSCPANRTSAAGYREATPPAPAPGSGGVAPPRPASSSSQSKTPSSALRTASRESASRGPDAALASTSLGLSDSDLPPPAASLSGEAVGEDGAAAADAAAVKTAVEAAAADAAAVTAAVEAAAAPRADEEGSAAEVVAEAAAVQGEAVDAEGDAAAAGDIVDAFLNEAFAADPTDEVAAALAALDAPDMMPATLEALDEVAAALADLEAPDVMPATLEAPDEVAAALADLEAPDVLPAALAALEEQDEVAAALAVSGILEGNDGTAQLTISLSGRTGSQVPKGIQPPSAAVPLAGTQPSQQEGAAV